MPSNIPKPPYDPELAPLLQAFPQGDIPAEGIPALRKAQEEAANLEITLAGEPFTHEERTISGPNGLVTLSVFYPKDRRRGGKPGPGIYHMHSGGLICGNRFTGFKDCLRWGKATGAVCIGVEYRLAPEHKFPVAVEDCYAGLKWVGEHLAELGIDPARLLIAGQSMGGNLAACVAVLARDRTGPALCGQLIDAGMLDDEMETNSSKQFVEEGTWSRGTNQMALNQIFGTGQRRLGSYAMALRAQDLSGLPPAFLCAGSAELFRDENVAYAQRLWAAGVQAELHVWPGGYHCFDMLLPNTKVSKASIDARTEWVKRIFEASTPAPSPKL